jgi:hypothetical protein
VKHVRNEDIVFMLRRKKICSLNPHGSTPLFSSFFIHLSGFEITLKIEEGRGRTWNRRRIGRVSWRQMFASS